MILLRMCQKIRKPLFASACACLGLLFISTTNFNCVSSNMFVGFNFFQNINVINGNGKGSDLGDISKVEKALNQLNCNDYFLNNVTGDLFQYNYEHDNWRPFANAGIHNFIAAEKNQIEGPYILRKEKYRIDYTDKSNVYTSKNTE